MSSVCQLERVFNWHGVFKAHMHSPAPVQWPILCSPQTSNRTEDGDTAVTQTIKNGETGNAPTLNTGNAPILNDGETVILLLHDSMAIAEGKVVCREVVHGVTLTKDEVVVNVVEVLTNYRVVQTWLRN